MKSVLWLASWYPNKTNLFDGDFIERHAKALSSFVSVTILFIAKDVSLPKGKFIVEKEICDNITVYRGYYGTSSSNKFIEKIISFHKYRRCQKEVYQQIITAEGVPHAVHVQVAMKAGMLALYLKKKFKIPFIVTEHWSGYYKYCSPNVYTGNWLINWLNKKVLHQADSVITVSNNLGKTIASNFVPIKFTVIPNVVDTRLFFYKPFLPPRFRFIHPSGMLAVKNPEGILAACKIVKEKGYNFELLMLGAQNEDLINLAERLGLLKDTVFFKGMVPYEAVATEMQQSSALLLFSRHENLSCVALEALCCGLPVICTAVGGMPEIITAVNGILVQSENISELANAMCCIIDDYAAYDRNTIAANAAAQFNYNIIGKQHLQLYK
jgi:glycosyltransferase involved in cell wall biosynthesis